MAIFNANRKYGIEIEIATRLPASYLSNAINSEFTNRGINQTIRQENYGHSVPRQWKIVPDGSVRGWEVVSPPLTGVEGKAELDAVCAGLATLGTDVKVDRTTGLHVHHDAIDLNARQIGNLHALYACFQHVFNYMVAPSRRNANYARQLSWESITQNGTDDFKNDVRTTGRNRARETYGTPSIERKISNRHHGRYSTLNSQSLNTHGTIEFRQHQGTMDAVKIWNWIVITQSIMESASERKNVPSPRRITAGKSSRGEFDRLKSTVAVEPWAHVRVKRAGQERSRVVEDSALAEQCKTYVNTYKYFAKRVKHFAKEANVCGRLLDGTPKSR